jgi:hypothetical protein
MLATSTAAIELASVVETFRRSSFRIVGRTFRRGSTSRKVHGEVPTSVSQRFDSAAEGVRGVGLATRSRPGDIEPELSRRIMNNIIREPFIPTSEVDRDELLAQADEEAARAILLWAPVDEQVDVWKHVPRVTRDFV